MKASPHLNYSQFITCRLFEDTGIVRDNQPIRDDNGLLFLDLHVS